MRHKCCRFAPNIDLTMIAEYDFIFAAKHHIREIITRSTADSNGVLFIFSFANDITKYCYCNLPSVL